MRCSDIRELLFDYLARELGEGRADLVRRHLEKCPHCKAAATEIQATVKALRGAETVEAPERLSPDRKQRIHWALLHPVSAWIARHHALVSVMVTLLLLACLLAMLLRTRIFPEKQDRGVSVRILRDADSDGSPGR